MATRVALLRGINVGSARRVAMADLRSLLEGVGYSGVRTYLQSGNVLLSSDAPPDELARELREHLDTRFGLEIAVLVRTREELARVVARDPLAGVACDPKRYQVSFLSAAPSAATVSSVSELATAAERVVFLDREIYAWHPESVHQSKLARALAAPRLGVTATARNWRTVTQLLAMAEER